MALSDILTVPFLISLGITLLLVGIIGMFFAQRMQEQNHKIASMLGLVTTMAEEMNFIRGKLQMLTYQESPQNMQMMGGIIGGENLVKNYTNDNKLISVSDDEKSDDESDSEVELDDSDNDSDSDDSGDSDDNADSEDDHGKDSTEKINNTNEILLQSKNVKVINFGEILNTLNDANDDENNSEDFDELDDLDDVEDLDDDNSSNENNNEQNEQNEETCHSEKIELNKNELEFIKSIDISNLEESSVKYNIDYKKMSLNKLKDIAVSKGLISDNSKVTKSSLLKMLDFTSE
jgi:hypothetical protein